MRHHWSLSGVFLVLFFAGTVAAQESLVEYNDKNDPRDRFKMRILMTVNKTDYKFANKNLSGGIDYKMVWNPCRLNEPQVAAVPLRLTPDWQKGSFVQRTFRLRPPILDQRTGLSSNQLSRP